MFDQRSKFTFNVNSNLVFSKYLNDARSSRILNVQAPSRIFCSFFNRSTAESRLLTPPSFEDVGEECIYMLASGEKYQGDLLFKKGTRFCKNFLLIS